MRDGIIWTAAASRELQEVYEQLEDRMEGDGARLLDEVERSLALLATQPFMGSYFEKPTRRLLVDRRYGIIYSPENRGLVLLSLVDLRQDMQPLRKRIRDWFGELP